MPGRSPRQRQPARASRRRVINPFDSRLREPDGCCRPCWAERRARVPAPLYGVTWGGNDPHWPPDPPGAPPSLVGHLCPRHAGEEQAVYRSTPGMTTWRLVPINAIEELLRSVSEPEGR